MHLLNLETVTVTIPNRTLLDAISLGLDDGDRVGVVGRNGGGKSTLLRTVLGEQTPDSGRVTWTGGLRIDALGQTDDFDPDASVLDVIHGDAPEFVWASDPRIRDVHDGLLGGIPLDAAVAELSGGQRRRVSLARVLVRDCDVFLLDEPTNHLDVESVAWLAQHLRNRWPRGKGAFVVVTHDRWFLDATCERTWEVTDGAIETYEGGYSAYILARAERSRLSQLASDKRDNLLRKELAWLRRGAPARTSKPKFRIEAANELIEREPPPRDSLELARTATSRLGKDVLDLEGVGVVLSDGRTLFDDVTWRLAPGERVGLVGVNGSGKTTLLRLLLGELHPSGGRIRRGKTVVPAILSQNVEELADVDDLRVLEAVESVRARNVVGGKEQTAGQLVERLGFTKERARTRVSDLSGGERRRLQLLRLLVGEPNVLLLDEPTNDLDTDTLAAVEDLLDGWPGTLVVVSHDRYLLERVTDHQVATLGDGRLRDLPGGVEEYLDLRRGAQGRARAASPRAAGNTTRPNSSATFAAQHSGTAAEQADPPAGNHGRSEADLRRARKDLARLEKQLQRAEARTRRLHELMAEFATDIERVVVLDAELRALAAETDAIESEWLTTSELAEG